MRLPDYASGDFFFGAGDYSKLRTCCCTLGDGFYPEPPYTLSVLLCLTGSVIDLNGEPLILEEDFLRLAAGDCLGATFGDTLPDFLLDGFADW